MLRVDIEYVDPSDSRVTFEGVTYVLPTKLCEDYFFAREAQGLMKRAHKLLLDAYTATGRDAYLDLANEITGG